MTLYNTSNTKFRNCESCKRRFQQRRNDHDYCYRCWHQRLGREAELQRQLFGSKSLLPENTRAINDVMRGVNGRQDKKFTAPVVGGFWKPPANARAAIARGDRKSRHGANEAAS